MPDRDANCLEEVLAGLIVNIWWWSCCSKCIKLDEQDWMRNEDPEYQLHYFPTFWKALHNKANETACGSYSSLLNSTNKR